MMAKTSRNTKYHHLLSRIITENDFSDTIKNGFKTCGLYPFDDNAVNYAKCIKENKKPNDDNPQTARIEPDQPQLTHRHYVESKIDSEVLERFKEKRASNETWDADDRNAALYELWMKIIDDEKEESMTLEQQEEPMNLVALDVPTQSTAEASGLTVIDEISVENVLEIPFPEFASSDTRFNEHPPEFMEFDPSEGYSDVPVVPISNDIGSDNSYTLIQNDISENEEPIILNEEVLNQTAQTENVDTDPRPSASVVTDFASSDIVIRKKSVDEVLDSILLWPKKQTTKSKKSNRTNEHTPSVLTSDKWIELMQAKEEAKRDEEERKRIRREERVARMELNKKIKAEKLEKRQQKKAESAETKTAKKRK